MADFTYNYIQVRDGEYASRIALLNDDNMWAYGRVGQTNTGTIKDGQQYKIRECLVFACNNGEMLRNVHGIDSEGNEFGYKPDAAVGPGLGGYYINGRLIYRFVPGQTGFMIIYLIHRRNDPSNRYRIELCEGSAIGTGMPYPVCVDGASYPAGGPAFDSSTAGWSRVIKANVNLSSGNVTLRCNLSSEGAPGGTYWPFDIATQTSSQTYITIDTPKEADANNPFDPNGYTGPQTPNGNFYKESDTVEPDEMPDEEEVGAVACGMISIFTPSISELSHLAEVLWGGELWTYVEKKITDIEDLVISLGVVPFVVEKGAQVNVSWHNFWKIVTPGVVTSVFLTKAAKQFLEFDMGSINLSDDTRIFDSDSCLDYSPYSRLGIYLPFIGFQELNIDECRKHTMHLVYRVDIVSGSCVAIISLDGRAMYQFSGNCMTQLPVTSSDASDIITNAVSVATAAASAGAAGAIASAGDAYASDALAASEGSALDVDKYGLTRAQNAGRVSNATGNLASATANAAMGMKPNYKKSGAIAASNSLLAVKQPYLCLETPNLAVPERYENYCGFPSNITATIGSCSGYTVIEDVRLNNLPALSPEVEEIYKLLKSGIIV